MAHMENPTFKTALGLLIRSMTQDGEEKQSSYHQIVLPIGATPPVLLNVGLPDLQLAISGKVIDKVIFDHGIPKGMLARIYALLESPKSIYKGHLENPGAVVVTYEVKNMAPIIIAIHPDRQMGRARFNKVASMYAKSTKPGVSNEDRWTREGLLLWRAR